MTRAAALLLVVSACYSSAPIDPASETTTSAPTTAPADTTTGAPTSTAPDLSESSDPGSTTTTTTSTLTTTGETTDPLTSSETTAPPPPPTCDCYAGDGPYCGHGVADHAQEAGCVVPELRGHESDILNCESGAWTTGDECPADCVPTTPGEADSCQLPVCACFVKEAWCGSGAAEHGLTLDPPCRVPLVPEHNDDILGCDGDEWIVQQKCDKGCHEEMLGIPDSCNDDSKYRLPFECGTKQTVSQGNNGSSHQGSQYYAWDFAMTKGTPVHAARAGTVAYLEVRSPEGSPCYDPPGLLEQCHNKANFIGVRHSDDTIALYMHLREMNVELGDAVTQGQHIAWSGNSGYTSGPHLHFQLQNDCGIWFCESVPVKFADAPGLAKGDKPESGNCP